MRIQIRTLSHSNFDLDVESTFTIEKIKELIEEKTQQSKSTQTLIFAGKLLGNELTLESANIKDQDFLVLISKKVKAPTTANPPTTQTSQPASSTGAHSGVEGPPQTTTTPVETSPAPPAANNNSASKPDTPAVSTEPAGLYSESAQALVTGTQFQSVVDEISSSMGFPKEQVVIALRASFGNPDRAVDYLLSGEIPESVLNQTQPPPQGRPNNNRPPSTPTPSTPQQPSQQQPPNRTPQQQTPQQPTNAPARPTTTHSQPRVLMTGGVVLPENIIPPSLASQIPNLRPPTTPAPSGVNVPRATGAGGNVGGGQPNLFSSLRDNPMFASLQQLARSNPQRFRELMNQLVQSNPQLGQLLAQHQNEFLQLFQGGGAAGGPAGLRPQGIQLQITPQDQEALDRLIALGFSRNRVIEAYFLFEKSEDAAANYLLNTKDDEDEMEFLEGDMEDDDNPDDAN